MLVFVDKENVFDRIDRNILWETLENSRFKEILFDYIRALVK